MTVFFFQPSFSMLYVIWCKILKIDLSWLDKLYLGKLVQVQPINCRYGNSLARWDELPHCLLYSRLSDRSFLFKGRKVTLCGLVLDLGHFFQSKDYSFFLELAGGRWYSPWLLAPSLSCDFSWWAIKKYLFTPFRALIVDQKTSCSQVYLSEAARLQGLCTVIWARDYL